MTDDRHASPGPAADAHLVTREHTGFWYDAALAPVLSVDPGNTVTFETLDARSRALDEIAPGTLFELPRPPVGRGNPLTGPVAVRGAEPGDALAVQIDSVVVEPAGWTGGHAHANPLGPGRIVTP